MKVSFLTIGLLLVTGCSYPHSNMLPYESDGTQKYDDPIITNTLLAMPIYTITFENQNFPRCHKKGFCVLPLKLYKEDYNKPNRGWSLMSSSNGFAMNAEFIDGGIDYGININSSSGKYEEEDNEREKGNVEYFKKKYPQRKLKNGQEISIDRHIERHGKENYFCEVSNIKNEQRGMIEKIYECHKSNLQKTRDKSVTITFIYTKSPNLPEHYKHLIDKYTYEDLLKRSQRVLDSLYIKDGWKK